MVRIVENFFTLHFPREKKTTFLTSKFSFKARLIPPKEKRIVEHKSSNRNNQITT
jgi:hypothetical protein